MDADRADAPTSEVVWTARDVVLGLGIILAWTLYFLAGVVVASFLLGSGPAFTFVSLGALYVTQGVLLAVAWGLSVRKYRLDLGALGLRAPQRLDAPLWGCLVLVLGFVANMLYAAVIVLLEQLFGWRFLAPPGPPEVFIQGGLATLASALLAVVGAPLAEEVFFRGFVFAGLAARWGFGWAAALSALVFSLGHLDPRVLPPIFILGVLLAWLYHRTRTLWAPIAVHAAYNGVTLALALLVAD